MPASAEIKSSQDPAELHLAGRWTLHELANLPPPKDLATRVDGSSLEAIDSAGALLLLTRYAPAKQLDLKNFKPEALALLELVRSQVLAPPQDEPRKPSWYLVLERVGAASTRAYREGMGLLAFTGQVLETLFLIVIRKRQLRMTATVFHLEQTGLDALPIVALLSFMVGSVIAFLGANLLADFGAAVLTVELVAFSFLREFGVLLAAILLAGRSGSAFAAEIGMMKANEEIDAIRALGLDPIELLVMPRMLALLIALPLLTLVGMALGILGGALVGTLALDISVSLFLTRLHEATEFRHFFVGMAKAPVFAFLIALTACRQGLNVTGSAESVGRSTTKAVVQGIFLVIVFDAIFALIFRELEL